MKRIGRAWMAAMALIASGAIADAYVDFGANGTNDHCQQCHKLFGDGPGDAEHDSHRTGVTGCTPCHGGFPAELSSPNPLTAMGCVGCHGRDEDAGGDSISDGFGRGLRQHHASAGVTECAECHDDTDGATKPAAGEHVFPPLYATYTIFDPCDGSEELFPSATVSLDNDGDLFTDGADPDCLAVTTTTTTLVVTTTSTTVLVTTTSTTLVVTTTSTTLVSTTSTTLPAPGLIPGGGPTNADCYVEAAVTGIVNPSDRVQKNKQVLVTDGDVGDQGACGDERCLVRVAVCVNQADPNLPDCLPPAVLDEVASKGKVVLPVPPAEVPGPSCAASIDVEVPTRVKRDGEGNVKSARAGKVKLRLSAKAPKGTKPRKDNDAVTLFCVPRTVACEMATGVR